MSIIQDMLNEFSRNWKYRYSNRRKTSIVLGSIAFLSFCLWFVLFISPFNASSRLPAATSTPLPTYTPYPTYTPLPNSTSVSQGIMATTTPAMASAPTTVLPLPTPPVEVPSISGKVLDFIKGNIDLWVKVLGLITGVVTLLSKEQGLKEFIVRLILWVVIGVVIGFVLWLFAAWEQPATETANGLEIISIMTLHASMLGVLACLISIVMPRDMKTLGFMGGLIYGAINGLFANVGANVNMLRGMLIWGLIGLIIGYLIDWIYD